MSNKLNKDSYTIQTIYYHNSILISIEYKNLVAIALLGDMRPFCKMAVSYFMQVVVILYKIAAINFIGSTEMPYSNLRLHC